MSYAKNPKSPADQVLIDHFGGMMIKDSSGKLRLLFKNDMSVKDMEHDIRLLLKPAT